MKTITYAEIKSFGPCYDPNQYISEDWSGTLKDILLMKNVAAKDRLWVAVRHQFLTGNQIHLYGLGCARLSEANSTDARVKACNDTTAAYLKGAATLEQLTAAYAAAKSAAWSAVSSAASSAAKSAASSAAYAASAAASYAASSAAYAASSAAKSAAWSAAYSAASSAAYAASSAARSAASSAAEEKQCELLIHILDVTNE